MGEIGRKSIEQMFLMAYTKGILKSASASFSN
jgi:hypothetical protein